MDYKRVLLLFPKWLTIADTIKLGFELNNWDVDLYDVNKEITKIKDKIHIHYQNFPYKVRQKWFDFFTEPLNLKQLELFKAFKPNLVIAYNGMFLSIDTIKEMQRSAKVCFFLGDSPFYTTRNDYYLPCLMQVDYLLCPDSYWENQFKGMGHSGTLYFQIASNPVIRYRKKVTEQEKKEWGSDLIFVGSNYTTAAGYKRAYFLNQFSRQDIKIYTNKKFSRWFSYFPELEGKVVFFQQRISETDLNTMLNCCKIYPVDANPGLINGIHLRIFECIVSGILPIAEYRKDVKNIFGPVGLPIIDNYNKGAEIAEYYLKHEKERFDIIDNLRNFTEKNFSPQIAIGNLLDSINFN